MEVHLKSDLESKLTDLAARQGRAADQLVQEAVERYVEDQAPFFQAVEEGIAAAERGEFVEHDEVWANVERILRS